MRSQTWLRKIDARNCVDKFNYHPLDAISCVEAMSGFAKLITYKPEGRTVDCCTSGWSPSIVAVRTFSVDISLMGMALAAVCHSNVYNDFHVIKIKNMVVWS